MSWHGDIWIDRHEVEGATIIFPQIGQIYIALDKITILLSGVHFGKFYGRPKKGVEPTYIDGDLYSNVFLLGGKTIRQWCGHIHTNTDDNGEFKEYFGELVVCPLPKPGINGGIWLEVDYG